MVDDDHLRRGRSRDVGSHAARASREDCGARAERSKRGTISRREPREPRVAPVDERHRARRVVTLLDPVLARSKRVRRFEPDVEHAVRVRADGRRSRFAPRRVELEHARHRRGAAGGIVRESDNHGRDIVRDPVGVSSVRGARARADVSRGSREDDDVDDA